MQAAYLSDDEDAPATTGRAHRGQKSTAVDFPKADKASQGPVARDPWTAVTRSGGLNDAGVPESEIGNVVREWSIEHLTQRHDEPVLMADCLISVGVAA